MPKLEIEIPEDLARSLKLPPDEAPQRLGQELAIRLYEKKILGFGKARQLAGMTKWEFNDLLGEEGVTRHFDLEELQEDLDTLEDLGSS